VSSILTSASWADVDTGAVNGIAIMGKVGNGTWQYSTDGTTWVSFGAVSSSNALLLTSSAQVRYVPDGQNGETASFAFRAWDQTSGTASTSTTPGYANAGSGSGTSAFSSQAATASISVTSVNDAPTLTHGSTVTLTGTDEDTTSSGTSVGTILGSAGWGDVDTGAASGIAITAGTADFLVIGFQGVRHIRMDDEAHVRPVNTHTERIRGDNDSGLARHESILHGLPVADGESRVVGNSIDVVPAECTMDVFNVASSAGIDDSRPAPGTEFDNRLHFLANGRHFPNLEIEVRPIESADHLGRTFDTELLEDVRTNNRRRRCRQSDNRRLPKTVDGASKSQIVRTKIMSPQGNAMCFVNGKQAHL